MLLLDVMPGQGSNRANNQPIIGDIREAGTQRGAQHYIALGRSIILDIWGAGSREEHVTRHYESMHTGPAEEHVTTFYGKPGSIMSSDIRKKEPR